MNILEACRDKNLFGPWFRDPTTWTAWFAFLAALFALPMTDEQLAIYRQHTGREHPPTEPSQEAWLICGRRAGKSFIMALCAVFLACFRDYREYLQPGERATIVVIASDRKQARVILRYVRGMLNLIPMLKPLIEREHAEGFDLTNRVTIEIGTASFRASRGYAFAAVLVDEVAFVRTGDDVANPDYEIIAAIRPGMLSIPGSILMCGSSPHARSGELWNAFRKWFGKDGAPLVWKATTREMNPRIPQAVIDAEMERDPARAAAEWNAEFRADIEQFVSREVVEDCVATGTRERPRVYGTQYKAFCDPSGGSADSFTLAIAHRDGETLVLDAIRERKPPFSPDAVVSEFAELLKSYSIFQVTGDRFGGEFPRELFRKHNISYVVSDKTRSELYRELLPMLMAARVDLLNDPKLVNQIVGLERRVVRGGRESIDHAPGAHDDSANAVAGALWIVSDMKRSSVAIVGKQSVTAPTGMDIAMFGAEPNALCGRYCTVRSKS